MSIATASDTIWVSQNHAETSAAAIAWTLPTADGLKILCGNDAAEPPSSLATTATVTTTGDFAITFASGHAYIYGITFNSGTGAGNASDILFCTNASLNFGIVFDTCNFKHLATGGEQYKFGITSGDCVFGKFINCDFAFSAAAHSFMLANGRWEMSGITLSGSTAPTTLVQTTNDGGRLLIENSDLSGKVFTNLVSAATTNSSDIIFRNCKMPAFTSVITGTIPAIGGNIVEMYNCDSADTQIRYAKHVYPGSVVQESTIVRTNGATDGTTPHSWKMVTLATGPSLWFPLYSPPLFYRQNTVGSAITVTVEVITDNVTLTDGEIWLEADYLSTAGFPQGTRITDRMTNVLSTPANQTTSTAAWTTTGLTTPVKQKLAVTFTPQEKGVLICRVALAKANTTAYTEPFVTVS